MLGDLQNETLRRMRSMSRETITGERLDDPDEGHDEDGDDNEDDD